MIIIYRIFISHVNSEYLYKKHHWQWDHSLRRACFVCVGKIINLQCELYSDYDHLVVMATKTSCMGVYTYTVYKTIKVTVTHLAN